jgi:hypothetical protein
MPRVLLIHQYSWGTHQKMPQRKKKNCGGVRIPRITDKQSYKHGLYYSYCHTVTSDGVVFQGIAGLLNMWLLGQKRGDLGNLYSNKDTLKMKI